MKQILLIFILILGLGFSLNAQSIIWQLTGIVVDEAGKPVAGATIFTDETGRAVTDSTGRFLAKAEKKPRALVVRHISYLTYRAKLDTTRWISKKASFKVILTQSSLDLNEVVISSNPVRGIFKEDFRLELHDYLFVGNNLLLLVRDQTQFALQYTTDDGEIISEMTLPNIGEGYLHHSCIDGYHVVGTRFAWEVGFANGKMDTFPRYQVKLFNSFIKACQVEKDSWYFYRKIGPFAQSVWYYYYTPERQKYPLITITDSVAQERAWETYKEFTKNSQSAFSKPVDGASGSFSSAHTKPEDWFESHSYIYNDAPEETMEVIDLIRLWDVDNRHQLVQLGEIQRALDNAVYAPMFNIRGEICIFDHINNKTLWVTGPEMEIKRTPLSYHKEKGWKPYLMKDEATQDLYALFDYTYKGYFIKKIDPKTGESTETLPIEGIPAFSEKFKIRNNVLYCLGQPDLAIPNRILYRISLKKIRNQLNPKEGNK